MEPLSDQELYDLSQGNTFHRIVWLNRKVYSAEDVEDALSKHETVALKFEEKPNLTDLDSTPLIVKHLAFNSLDEHNWYAADFMYAYAHRMKHLETLSIGYVQDFNWLHELDKLRCLSIVVNKDAAKAFINALTDSKCVIEELELWSDNDEVLGAIVSMTSLRRLSIREIWARKEVFLNHLTSPECNIYDLGIEWEAYSYLDLANVLRHPDCTLRSLRARHWGEKTEGYRQFLDALKCSKLQHLSLYDMGDMDDDFVKGLETTLHEDDLKLTSLSLRTSYHLDMESVLSSKLTHLRLDSGQFLFESSQRFERAISTSRLRHLTVRGTNLVPLGEQRKLVAFLNRNIDCPLVTLDLDKWKSQVLHQSCLQILKRNKLYREGGLLEEGLTTPSNAKLFICGDSGVGKTTIRKNLARRVGIPSIFQSSKSSYGIKLQALCFTDTKLIVCDLAGQSEYHAFHHYFVRGSDKDLFLLVCKAPTDADHPAELEKQLKYWLRFIVAHRSLSHQRPRVLILLNYFPTSQRPTRTTMKELAWIRCRAVIQEYSQCIDFGDTESISVYGIVATTVSQVRQLKGALERALEGVLEKRPKVPLVCNHIMNQLNATQQPKVVPLQKFRYMYNMRNFEDNQFKASLMHLHDSGELVYFEDDTPDETQQFVVLDVQWFLRDVIGVFLPRLGRNLNDARPPAVQPITSVHAQLATRCEATHIPYILSSLQKLGVVLLETQVRILPLLEETLQQWEQECGRPQVSSYCFWGRRFDCKHSETTILPSGIFNMLQVTLAGMFSQHKVGRGWLYLVENRIHVIVKIGGSRGEWYDMHWVDVLVRIPFDSETYLLEQAENLFQRVNLCIAEVCGAPNWGCPALELEEKVIRPQQIESNLSSSFEDVCPLDSLVEELDTDGRTLLYEHTWPSLQSNPIYELLVPSERDKYFAAQQNNLNVIGSEVQECLDATTIDSEHSTPDGTSELTIGDKVLLKRMERCESNIVRQIRISEVRITSEIHRLELVVKKQMDAVHMQGGEILSKLMLHMDFEAPKYPYITDENNFLQKLSRSAFGSTVRLHFLCEHHQHCHPMENQRGIEITVRPEWLKKAAPVLVPALRIMFFALKLVAIAGFGVVIPSPASAFPKGLKDGAIQAVMEAVFGNVDKHLKSGFPTRDELKEFHESLDMFLKGRDLERDLGLRRRIQNGQHVWLCQQHQ